jgi:hypothetical protein
MWKSDPPTRPDIQRVKLVQQQERPTWKPPRRRGVAIAWKEEVAADLSRDGRIDPE